MKILIKLTEIFQDIFDDTELIISRETTQVDIEEWDSLEHIKIINAVENEFCINFTIEDMLKIESIGDLMDIIKNKTQ